MEILKIKNDSNIKILGRTINSSDSVDLVWTGSGVEMNIKASELWLCVEAPYESFENWIAVEINGEILQRRPLDKEKSWIQIFRGMNSENVTHVRILKETQANSADPNAFISIYEYKTDGVTVPLSQSKMKIEFIGDSINSAEGAIGAKADMDWISQYFSHVNSYPYFVGKKLDAEIRVFSQSGFGLYISWDNDRTHAVPPYYEKICSIMGKGAVYNKGFNEKWDFSSWQPDYIVINLGTNDEAAFNYEGPSKLDMFTKNGDEYNIDDLNKVKETLVKFLYTVRKNNPNSYIIWAFDVFNGKITPSIEESVNKYIAESKDEKVCYLKLKNFTDETVGSRAHPGRLSHLENAEIISNFISSLEK